MMGDVDLAKKLFHNLTRSRCVAPDVAMRGGRNKLYRRKIQRLRPTKQRNVRRKQMPATGYETAS